MHSIRLMITGMFVATVVAGALLLGFGTSGASAAPQRSCSQSVTTGGRPGGLSVDYHIWVKTDTCGRWMRAAERCKYDITGTSYVWKAGKSVRPSTSNRHPESTAVCGDLGHATNWGFQFYVRGTGWIFKQEGHAAKVTRARLMVARSPQVTKWTDLRNCKYKVTVYSVGANGFEAWVNTDTCGHAMWAVARCYDSKTLYGNVVYSHSRWTSTYVRSSGCGAGNIGGLRWWGVRDKQFVTHTHMANRLHCLSGGCNS